MRTKKNKEVNKNYNIKRNYNTMSEQSRIESNDIINKIHNLPLPKLYYQINIPKNLETVKVKSNHIKSINKAFNYYDIENYTVNIYILKLNNFKCIIPKSFFIRRRKPRRKLLF